MSEVATNYVETTVAQTTTSTAYVDITGATISSANFSVGDKFLIVATANLGNLNDANTGTAVQLVHGSTAFAASECVADAPGAGEWTQYMWFTVWTAVSGEDIDVQFKTLNAAKTAKVNFVTMFTMNLSANLTENTDWFYNENSTSVDLDAIQPYWTTTNNASINFAPPLAGPDWLVMATARIEVDDNGVNYETRLSSSGTYDETQPMVTEEGEQSTDVKVQTLVRVFTTLEIDDPQTFSTESRLDGNGTGGGVENRTHNAVFALNLDAFESRGSVWTEAETAALSTTAFNTQVQTLNFTPTTSGNVWILGFWVGDGASTVTDINSRLQVANADQPPGQTSPPGGVYDFGFLDSTDEMAMYHQTRESLAGLTAIDIDGSASSSGPVAEDRMIMALSLVLAATYEDAGTDTADTTDSAITTITATPQAPDGASLTDTATANVEFAGPPTSQCRIIGV